MRNTILLVGLMTMALCVVIGVSLPEDRHSRSPLVELREVSELFASFDGQLVSSADRTVIWTDTKLFRMYSFRHHTVLVYPRNWTKDKFNIILFAGHVQPDGNLYDSILGEFEPDPANKSIFPRIAWRLDQPVVKDVVLLRSSLGERRDVVLAQQISCIRRAGGSPEYIQLGVDNVTRDKGFGVAAYGDVYADLVFEYDRLAYVNLSRRGHNRLGGISLLGPAVAVEATGELVVPENMRPPQGPTDVRKKSAEMIEKAGELELRRLQGIARPGREKEVLLATEEAIPRFWQTRSIKDILQVGHWAQSSLRGGKQSSTTKANDGSGSAIKEIDLNSGVALQVAFIPAGRFIMGTVQPRAGWQSAEGPARVVTISKPFYMSRCEVTQEQYEAVMDNNPSYRRGKGLPVTVCWNDGDAFCKALSQRSGKTVRLPTEAEWEYGCRAGTTDAFSTGDSLLVDNANFGQHRHKSEVRSKTVGSYASNAFGLFDMHGNVWEWCSDWYQNSYEGLPATDPKGPPTGPLKVIRGGGWSSPDWCCRSASRGYQFPDVIADWYGFRVVIEVESKSQHPKPPEG